jgi:hypothetical protein
MLKQLEAYIPSQIRLWPFTTGQNRQNKYVKNTTICHMTLWLTPRPPLSVTYYLYGPLLSVSFAPGVSMMVKHCPVPR